VPIAKNAIKNDDSEENFRPRKILNHDFLKNDLKRSFFSRNFGRFRQLDDILTLKNGTFGTKYDL
jgi:hypothetical protein